MEAEEKQKIKVELLAPAGSVDVMKACIASGADAVYMGLNKFSARANANNATVEEYREAISYAHLRGVRLYLTINTLTKNKEFDELEEALLPLYRAGLDAVIVQDVGVMAWVSRTFPKLPIHVSTQATVLGPGAAEFYRDLNVTRIVPARELTLNEIADLQKKTGMEIETFVHGALCYSYSGQCFFSSYVGGRSANRGRCAQPCRLEYALKKENGTYLSSPKAPYLLSLKDLNTISFLPEIIRAGVSSLKIEGRMKKCEYAAGVTYLYRQAIDRYVKNPDLPYTVDEETERLLFSLFNREGFSEGYYHGKSGSMVALHEKEFRKEEEKFLTFLRENFIRKEKKCRISASFSFNRENGAVIRFFAPILNGETISYREPDFPIEKAIHPIVKEDVIRHLEKTGNTDFSFDNLTGEVEEGIFLPVSALNAFRRNALTFLKETLIQAWVRE